MYSVSFSLSNKTTRKQYKTESGALRGIRHWLAKHQSEPNKSALLFAPNTTPELFTDSEQLLTDAPQVDNFYSSLAWQKLRVEALVRYGAKCVLCGADANDAKLQVDHIKPRSLYPDLALDINNLQILCEPCNKGKSNLYDMQWR